MVRVLRIGERDGPSGFVRLVTRVEGWFYDSWKMLRIFGAPCACALVTGASVSETATSERRGIDTVYLLSARGSARDVMVNVGQSARWAGP